MINDYIPLEQYAKLEEIDKNKLKKCMYTTSHFNYLRFRKQDNKILVCNNFNAPFKDILFELKNKALIIAKTENNLCRELSILSNNVIKEAAIQKYFYRSRFKRIEKALEVIALLKMYIKKNSLFPESDLNYD